MENFNYKDLGITKYQYRLLLEMLLEIIRSCKDLKEAKSKIERLVEK